MLYTAKPITIDAFKWTGDIHQKEDPVWCVDAIKDKTITFNGEREHTIMAIRMKNGGVALASFGDYIIQGTDGDIYPCTAEVFENKYEPVETK